MYQFVAKECQRLYKGPLSSEWKVRSLQDIPHQTNIND